ncbi:quinone oxidoreductase family protein [Peribacillus frigoritolerans]|uniref:quinone oxidoreductase family protein n=1 Tax=Peribacillus frigoritolerans TaxID=450367 RepID=UPI0010597613|nr:quinone oxidoreductase [Peribacillus frigoritolerans]TDL79167.1 quinone oxidoreductase [Peribacillus frigoritolerans]
MRALVFNQFGGPEVLTSAELEKPVPGPDEVLISMKAAGLNFADVYRRKGNYHLEGEPPYILGYEGAGIVEEIGSEVRGIKRGDRVGFADVPHSNAEFAAAPSQKVIPLPDEISFETAASVLLQGLTAHYLTSDSYKIKAGDTAIVHAAAGGVGQLLVQIIRLLGGRVIALVSTHEKANIAKAAGAEEAFVYTEDWKQKVLELTSGKGADVVFESVGSTLMDSFDATRIGGTVVFYGMAGGDPVHIDPRMLMDTSKTLTGGDLWNVLTSREERISRSNKLFGWIEEGSLRIAEPSRFALEDGAKAHRYLESRKSTGKIVLIP